jgi:hypothetical protein
LGIPDLPSYSLTRKDGKLIITVIDMVGGRGWKRKK